MKDSCHTNESSEFSRKNTARGKSLTRSLTIIPLSVITWVCGKKEKVRARECVTSQISMSFIWNSSVLSTEHSDLFVWHDSFMFATFIRHEYSQVCHESFIWKKNDIDICDVTHSRLFEKGNDIDRCFSFTHLWMTLCFPFTHLWINVIHKCCMTLMFAMNDINVIHKWWMTLMFFLYSFMNDVDVCDETHSRWYEGAMVSRLLKIIRLFCRIQSLL